MTARPLVLWGALALTACNAALPFDAEGYRCNESDPCPDGYACLEGLCRSRPVGQDLCQGVVCNAPPAPTCSSPSTLRSFDAVGACTAQGDCQYTARETSCPKGCQEGACIGDACQSLVCQTPPAPSCLDASTLVTYATVGTCQTGACQYAATPRSCTHGCENGNCVDQDLCIGMTCQKPPPPSCIAGKVRTYAATGTCQSTTGQCSYAVAETTCDGTCQGNLCVPPALAFDGLFPRVAHPVSAVDQAFSPGGNHVLAVGPSGRVSRWNGIAWAALPSSQTMSAHLRAVWLASATSGYVVGDDKTVLRYDGSQLLPVKLPGGPGQTRLTSVHGASMKHVLIADDVGNVWRFDGADWSHIVSGMSRIAQVHVDERLGARAVGQCASAAGGTQQPCSALLDPTAKTFTPFVDTMMPAGDAFLSVGPSPEGGNPKRVLLGRSVAALRRQDDAGAYDAPVLPAPLAGGAVVGIAGDGQAVYALTERGAGAWGFLYRLVPGQAPAVMGAFALGSAAGGGQALSRNDANGVVVADSGPQSATVLWRGPSADDALDLGEHWAAAAYGAQGLILMNAQGDLATAQNNRVWRLWRAGRGGMRSLVAANGYLLLAGAAGQAVRVSSSAVQPLTTGVTQTLTAGCRVSDGEVYLVGEGGVLLQYNGGAFARMGSPTTQDLHDVVCVGPGRAFAVGVGGTVLRLQQGSWSALTYPNPAAALQSASVTPSGALYVAGDGVFTRFENGAWTPLAARAGLTALAAFGPAEVYASAGNELLRFNGSSWGTVHTAKSALVARARGDKKLAFVGPNGLVVESP